MPSFTRLRVRLAARGKCFGYAGAQAADDGVVFDGEDDLGLACDLERGLDVKGLERVRVPHGHVNAFFGELFGGLDGFGDGRAARDGHDLRLGVVL